MLKKIENKNITVKQALHQAVPQLPTNSPRLDAEVLLSWVIKKNRTYLLAHHEHRLNKQQAKKYTGLIKKRSKHEPIAYLIGRQPFYDLDFNVNKQVLIPRPETELIIDYIKTLKATNKKTDKANATIIDLGTGSGCIIITAAKHKLGKQYFAVDISQAALTVAKTNARQHHQQSIKFFQGNLLIPIIKRLQITNKTKQIKIASDNIIITANLPYVGKEIVQLLHSTLSKGIKYEPQIALRGGIDGLKYYRLLARQLKIFKKILPNKNIIILCEISHGQVKGIKKIFAHAHSLVVQKDLAGKNRLVIIQY
jgi:release factor glutamine methyltransferase